MPVQKQIFIFRIEYEVIPSTDSYVAYVGATSHEEAIEHIYSFMKGKQINVTTSGQYCPLHDLTPAVRAMVVRTTVPKTKEVKKDVKKEVAPVGVLATQEPEKEEYKFKSGRGRKPGIKKAV